MLSFAKWVAAQLAFVVGLAPFSARRALLRMCLLVESRIGAPDAALRRLFAIEDDISRLLAERATAYGGGINPKHRLIGYHDFFVSNIPPASRVLDIGCGVGEVARSIAGRVRDADVVGVDSDPKIIAAAKARKSPDNLSFELIDATQSLPAGPWDVIVLSNVIEHIEERVDFLREVVIKTRPSRILVRVPLFERHWHLPLRRELGVDFRSDPTHCIEHTQAEFESEMASAGLRIASMSMRWGEIWAVTEPKG